MTSPQSFTPAFLTLMVEGGALRLPRDPRRNVCVCDGVTDYPTRTRPILLFPVTSVQRRLSDRMMIHPGGVAAL